MEEAWGDYLVSSKNMENAINHYIEAGASTKAIEASLSARQWKKAGELVDALSTADSQASRPYYLRIARHYHESSQYEQAAKFYVMAECEKEAIEMYTDANLWDSAHKLAVKYMSDKEARAATPPTRSPWHSGARQRWLSNTHTRVERQLVMHTRSARR